MSESVFRKLEQAVAEEDFRWSLQLVSETQINKFDAFSAALRRPYSATGDGKYIPSGFSYWGSGPTQAWSAATSDPLYPIMSHGLAAYLPHWTKLLPDVLDSCRHLVCFGVGTGIKDGMMLSDLYRANASMIYVPVDMSADMLRLGTVNAARNSRFPIQQVLPVQLDFSMPDNVEDLGRIVNRLVGDDPVLYCLTGNTLPNFDDDEDLLRSLSAQLRPRDMLLLEVATTSVVDQEAAALAATEYEQGRSWHEFVVSAMRHHTDLAIERETVNYWGSVRDDALLVKIVWQNDSGLDRRIRLPDTSPALVKPNDTIRLYLSRKYSEKRLAHLANACDLKIVNATGSPFRRTTTREHPFGLRLALLAKSDAAPLVHDASADAWA